jgi:hypothetical protein
MGLASLLLCLACKTNNSTTVQKSGVCADTCPKDCKVDNDCDVTRGELCCNYPGLGSTCQSAASCPRFCSTDTMCDTTQACVRYSLDDKGGMCAAPQSGIRTCKTDMNCKTGEKCCGIYSEAVCLPVGSCPVTCSDASKCNTAQGEICCTTLDLTDHTLTAPGLCIDPAAVTCPKACQKSSDCRTQDGEVCCNGVCSKTCATRTCDTSSECVAQICCKSPVVARGSGTPTGVPVPVHPTGSGGASGTGGLSGAGGVGSGVGGASGGLGGASGGLGGTGGAMDFPPCTCATCSAAIDDMESGYGGICPGAGNGRVGFWFSYADAATTFYPMGTPLVDTTITRGSSTKAMVTHGTVVQYAGFGCYLNFSSAGSLNPSTYNASGYTGIQFYAIGQVTQLNVVIQTASTESSNYGGTCSLATCTGNSALGPPLTITDWTPIRMPFSAFSGGTSPFDVTQIWSIEFQPGGTGTFELAIDDLSFY